MPAPRLVEIDHADVAVPPQQAYTALRGFDLGRSPLVSALFNLRTLPERLTGAGVPPPSLRIDRIGAGQEPGFRMLRDEPGAGFAVGAVGRFWEADITFADVAPAAFCDFGEPGWAKVAWALHFVPWGEGGTRIVCELRLTATDEAAWHKVRRYFRVIGPFSHLIRRHMLSLAAAELGPFEAAEQTRPLPGDEIIPAPKAQVTHGITIEAPPERIWPWLVQLGCHRGGWYSYDLLDNGAAPSARAIVPELQALRVGQVLPATPEGAAGFTVLRIDEGRALVLGGTLDLDTGREAALGALPARYWRTSWAFALEPLDPLHTRLHVRARLDYAPASVRWTAMRMGVVHHFMQREQLRNLKRRAEGRLPHHEDTIRDVGEGIVGALGMAASLLTPFLRRRRSHWGVDEATAARSYPGDSLVAEPTWDWTHGVEIDAPPEAVWPWVVQIGQGQAGFYSYQWLENLAGCDVQNGERVNPAWQDRKAGDEMKLHPSMTMRVAAIEPGRWFVATAGLDPERPNLPPAPSPVRASWLFFVEPLGPGRSRLISRYRVAVTGDWRTRLAYGPAVIEPIGFMMDRRMLLGVKERAERGARP